MNWYEHHIGDFLKKTAHLSMLEECAYRRLLDRYYSTEKPLPGNVAGCIKLARATSPEEHQAVESVLREFFRLGEDGCYHQGRADEEIAAYQASGPDREAKKKNNRDRQDRARQRRRELFEVLRRHGLSPPYNTKVADLEAMLSRVTQNLSRVTDVTGPGSQGDLYPSDVTDNALSRVTGGVTAQEPPEKEAKTHESRADNAPVTPPVTRDQTATHYPLPTTHIKPIQDPTPSVVREDPARGFSEPHEREQPQTTPPDPPPDDAPMPTPTEAGRVCMLMRAYGLQDAAPGHIDLLTLIRIGATDEEFIAAAKETVKRGKRFAYAIGMMVRQREEAAKRVLHQGPMPVDETPGQRAARQTVEKFAPGIAAKAPGPQLPPPPPDDFIDIPARRVD